MHPLESLNAMEHIASFSEMTAPLWGKYRAAEKYMRGATAQASSWRILSFIGVRIRQIASIPSSCSARVGIQACYRL
jgi:hypothetical protein